MNNPDTSTKELREAAHKTMDAYLDAGGPSDFIIISRKDLGRNSALQSAKKDCERARIDENESLLSVAEHEISLPDHCDMHDKYASYCHACKKRKWYGEISKDWKRVIEERIAELTLPQEQKRKD